MASDLATIPAQPFRTILEGELEGLRTTRYSWWLHWAELARFILPRRYRWLVTPNQLNRGSAVNQSIIDSTGTVAARVLASGMMAGITSPSMKWFDLMIEGYDKDEVNAVNLWLAEVRRRMMRVFSESNFYNAIAIVYADLAVFATAPMLIYEDFENVINCVNPCAGEYYLGLTKNLRADIFYREIVMTITEMVKTFGEKNCSDEVKLAYKQGGAGTTMERAVCHAIRPNMPGSYVNEKFLYMECYWERGNPKKEQYLSQKGFFEFPGITPRWSVTGNDAYGSMCPGMEALGDIKQLQQEQKRKAQAIDKLANPPMVADVELKNQPASTIPGGVTYITKKDGAGFKPAYENFRPPIQELMTDIQDVQGRIKRSFYNDLFLMFQDLQAEPRSAAAVDVRREEKLIMLGPVLERFFSEGLDPAIDRVFNIMNRAGLLPPPPPEIEGAPIQVSYSSMLAQSQRATETIGIERFLALVGNMGAIHPEALDVPNWDKALEKYNAALANDPDLINLPEVVAANRDAKRQQQQMAYLTELGQGAAKAGKTLADTDVGGGQNALQMMIGGPQL